MPAQLRAHLFADLYGYSRMVNEQGEREVAKVMRTYERIVRKHAATRALDIERVADTFHLVFRLPVDAVRCAIEIADALTSENVRATTKIAVHFGVDAGQSVRGGGHYVGSAPVLASRLCSRARPGQVLVSEAIHNLIKTAHIPTRDLGVWKPKGVPTVHVYEARAPDDESDATDSGLARFLSAFLFTDIASSTAGAAAAGDRRWRDIVEQHHAIIREELERHHGTEIDTAGDGFYAVFDSPSRAIRCALIVGNRVHAIGVDIRAGIHVGECEIVAGKIGGMAVVIGARIKDKAGAGEVLVSDTVKNSLVGTAFSFADKGRHVLKGAPGEWQLHSVLHDEPGSS
ncbi:MAG: adenylate/guanylate cyclase domain-containing protein [Chloroflexota bacterium]|nr:adenylate/guanylate cyclase domain-containing protein [Chloroflexota bacterium]